MSELRTSGAFESWMSFSKTRQFLLAPTTPAILQAVRIALSRLWGRRGTGFTEHDVHCPGQTHDPKTAPPVRVLVRLEERESETWDPDMVSALDDLVVLNDLGRNLISLRVTFEWNQESKAFEPAWEFLNAA